MKNHALAVLAVAGLAAAANADVFNGAGFAIPDNNVTGATSSVNVTGLGNVTGLTVTINFGTSTGTAGTTREHSFSGDLIATLTGPGGTFTLFARPGRASTLAATATGSPFGSGDDLNGSYTFSDAGSLIFRPGAGGWTVAGGNVPNGTYQPSTYNSPAAGSLLGFFGGGAANGTWTLFVGDFGGGDVGDVVSWSLDIVPTPGAAGLLGLGGLVAMRRRRA